VLHCERRISENLFQDRFRARDQVSRRHDLVNESDAISFLSRDHSSGKNELKRATFADEAWQTLGSAAAGDYSQFHFRLTELCALSGDSNRASHRGFTSAAEGEAVNRGNHGFAQIFDH